MKHEPKLVSSFWTSKFNIAPIKAKSPFNIDGDPHDMGPVDVEVLNRVLSVFAHPPLETAQAAAAPAAPAAK